MPKYKPNDAGTEGLDRIQRLEKHVADSPTLTPSSSLDNVIQPTAAGTVPLVLKAAAGQTADLLQIQDQSGAVIGGFSAAGGLNGGSPAVFNVVAQYGADNTGVSEASSQIQAAVTAASAAGGGTVYLPKGTYKVSTPIVPASGVNIIGAGPSSTILKGYGNAQVFFWDGPNQGPAQLTDVTFADFQIDGSNQANSGVYTSAMKGIQVHLGLRNTYRNLYIHHCGATGLGSDNCQDSSIISCVCDFNGRLNSGAQAGGAGIGIGTGTYAVENWTIVGCITRSNGTNGLFFENQSGVQSTGIVVVGHLSSSNVVHGIADAGVSGLQVIGGRSTDNGAAGFANYKGTYVGASGPGIQGRISGLEVTNNTTHGIHLDGTNGAFNDYVIENCRIWQNLTHGILVDAAGSAVTNVHLRDNKIYLNHNSGIFVKLSGGTFTGLNIVGNAIYNNGLQTGANVNLRAAIRISCAVVSLWLKGNRCWDDQATKTQSYGLILDSVSLTGPGEIDGNSFGNNLTGVVLSTATYSSFRIGRNEAWTVASGAPTFTAPKSTIYQRVDGAAGSLLYVNQDGATTWAAYA